MFKLARLALLLGALSGCATAPQSQSHCVAGNPGGSLDCQAEVYRNAP